jgi:hypothetical protein
MVSHVNFRHCSHHNGSLTVTAYNRMLDKFCDGQTETYVCLPNLVLALGFCLQSDFAKLCSTQLGMMLTSGNGVRILTGQSETGVFGVRPPCCVSVGDGCTGVA